MLKRYITVVDSDLEIKCYAEDEDWNDAQNDAEEWVWQYAESKGHAIAQHYLKHDEWSDDQDNEHEFKDTY